VEHITIFLIPRQLSESFEMSNAAFEADVMENKIATASVSDGFVYRLLKAKKEKTLGTIRFRHPDILT
jgi:hypothetical protein